MSLALDEHGRGSARGGLRLLQLVEQFIVEAMPVLDKIPRAQRYRYGAQLEEVVYGLIDDVVSAASSGQKSKVYALCDHIEALHALLRVGAERKLIAPRFVGRMMAAPGRDAPGGGMLRQIAAMAAAWRRSVKSS
ncbi:MAG: four helix bundle protein [Rhodocyclaceae bacterium]|nr:four helix bundle protein [Rhodocyclaceae bacterium]